MNDRRGQELDVIFPLRPLINGTVIQIIDLMRISEESKRSYAAQEISSILEHALVLPAFGTVGDNIKNLQRIGTLAAELLRGLEGLNPASKEWLANADLPNSFDLDRYRKLTETLINNAAFIKQKRKAAHRPRGSVKNKFLSILLCDLFRIARDAGGHLTLGLYMTKHKPNGTLPKILSVLHSHLPAIVPANVPYSTLDRMRQSALRKLSGPRDARDAPPPPA